MTNPEQLLTPEQVSNWLAERGFVMSEQMVRRELRKGRLPGTKVGRSWLTSVAQLRAHFGCDAVPVAGPTSLVVPIAFMGHRKSVAS